MSNEPTIEQMNEAIALFMGGSSIKELGGKRYVYYPKSCARYVVELKYHSSWDWLMPVVIKVNDTLYNMWNDGKMHELVHMEASLRNNFIKFVDKETGWYLLDQITGDTLKEALYKAVYQFIQWYNKQSTTTNEQA